VVVGLDFGTTFTGFAFAHVAEPERIYTFYEYPSCRGERPYCKTLTGIYYKQLQGKWQYKSWGYPARGEYEKDFTEVHKHRARGPSNDPLQPTVGTCFTKFKLHLAGRDMGPSSAAPLPPGITVTVLITDYLREIGTLIITTLQTHYGRELTMKSIQWCETVPSIWSNAAKATMKQCMAAAGLVDGAHGSPHPLVMVLEPEAASFHCHKVMSEQTLRVGDKLLVADIGGGTADIVVQEVVSVEKSSYRVKEVTTSSGGLCGGTYVDQRFMEFLHTKIGPGLQAAIFKHPNLYALLIKIWEAEKVGFGEHTNLGSSTDINLPSKLVTELERYDERMGLPPRDSYDELEISYQEMQSIFDPVVARNLELISTQLDQAGGGVRVLAVVGGFASSPYLMDCIRKKFASRVPQIITPPNPGSAVCQGAVMLALNPETVVSRICKKTYGIEFNTGFEKNRDLSQYRIEVDGVAKCSHRFEVYVRKGEKVDVDACISRTFSPLHRNQRAIKFQLFSSSEADPRYTVGEGVRKEGEIEIDISMDMRLDRAREVKVSLFFGGSVMEIKAEAVNFSSKGSKQLELPVEVGFC
jgi:molecular chaperone DnaK (HSP70)